MSTQEPQIATHEYRVLLGPQAETSVTKFVCGLIVDGKIGRTPGERLRLILEELVTNMLTHGSPEQKSEINIKINSLENDSITLTIVDKCVPFNPLSDLCPDDRGNELDDRRIGGLGWPLILELSEIEHYERTANGENLLILKIKI